MCVFVLVPPFLWFAGVGLFISCDFFRLCEKVILLLCMKKVALDIEYSWAKWKTYTG